MGGGLPVGVPVDGAAPAVPALWSVPVVEGVAGAAGVEEVGELDPVVEAAGLDVWLEEVPVGVPEVGAPVLSVGELAAGPLAGAAALPAVEPLGLAPPTLIAVEMPPVGFDTLVVVTVVIVVGFESRVRLGGPVGESARSPAAGATRGCGAGTIAGRGTTGGSTAGDVTGAAAGVAGLECGATTTTRPRWL